MAATGTLTLNGAGTYIFQVGSSLTANVLSNVNLIGGATPCNVFWQVTSAATLNGTNFPGTVVAQAGVTLGVGASLAGRALTTTLGSVTMAGTNTVGGCSAPVPPLGAVALAKAFVPATITAGGVSIFTITLSNNNAGAATLTAPLTDTLPAGVVIAPTPNASTTCGVGVAAGGVVSAVAGGSTVSLSTNSTIPGGSPGTCVVTVNVPAPGAGTYNNTLPIGALATTNGSNTVAAAATLTVLAAAVVNTSIPTISEWGLIILAGLLALFGFVAVRRQAR